MRLHRLDLTAFGAFAGHETIDFGALNASGLFLLNGVTGAGRTSVLDALCSGLCGSVPGGRSRHALRSHHAEPATAPEVRLELTAAGRRSRLERSPAWEAPSARAASGTAARPAKALLMERGEDGGREALATRLDDVGEQVEDVVGLTLEQFTQVILLPQGQFAEFLRASSADREAVLKRLFGTAFYERVQEELACRSRTARAAAEAATVRTARLVTDSARELEHVRRLDPGHDAGDGAGGGALGVPGTGTAAAPAVAAALGRVRAAQERARAAQAGVDSCLADVERHAGAVREELRLVQRLEALRAQERELEHLRPAVEQDRSLLERHRTAGPLRVVRETRRRPTRRSRGPRSTAPPQWRRRPPDPSATPPPPCSPSTGAPSRRSSAGPGRRVRLGTRPRTRRSRRCGRPGAGSPSSPGWRPRWRPGGRS